LGFNEAFNTSSLRSITKDELFESKKDASAEELTGSGESLVVVDDVKKQGETTNGQS
jgi:hypothetical protein